MDDRQADATAGFKQCPDCAEMVRAQARKCRFCGYRFDEPAASGPGRGSRAARGALGALTARGGSPASVTELLAQWGHELEQGEHVAFFVSAEAVGSAAEPGGVGFLVVTDRRLAFYVPKRRSILRREQRPSARVVVERRHEQGAEASIVSPRWRKAELRLDGDLALRGIAKSTLLDIEAFLAERVVAA